MKSHRILPAGVFALGLALASGCNDGKAPPPPTLAVVSLNDVVLPGASPLVLDLVEPVPLTLRGIAFGEPGSLATVIFRTVDGSRPFVNGTLDSIELPGDVVSDTEIRGVLALPGVADPVDVTVAVEVADGSVSDPKAGVQLEDSSLEAPEAMGPARLLDLDGDGQPGAGDEIVVLFERRIKVGAGAAFPLLPGGSLGIGAAPPYAGGPDGRELHVPLGAAPALRTRHAYDAALSANAPTAIAVTTASGVTNIVDEAPEQDAVLDIIPGFALGRDLVDQDLNPVPSDTRAMVTVDLNRDGVPDVLAVDHRGALVLYAGRIAPPGLAPALPLCMFAFRDLLDASNNKIGEERVEVTIGTGFFEAAAAGDLNGDCFPDLVVARSGGLDWALFWNETEQCYERVQELSFLDSTAVALGDLDRDGDLDIVAASKGGGSRVWLNEPDGAGNPFQDSGLRLDPTFVTESVVLDDVDADGDPDIVLGHFGEPNTVWFNHPKDPADPSAFPRTFGTDAGDLDGDGNDDFVGEPVMKPARTFGLAVGDLDGDGDPDYVEAIFDGLTRIWFREDDGASRFREGQTLEEEPGDRRSLALGDVDGDGDLDICIGTAGTGTSVWLNDGSGTFTDSLQRLGTGRIRAVALADFDLDGDLDLATGHPGATDRLWFNSLSGTWGDTRFAETAHADVPWTAAVAIGGGASGEAFRVAAVDAAGRNELWRSGANGLERVRSLDPSLLAHGVALGDLDGDAQTEPDVVVAHAGGLTIEWGDGVTAATETAGTYAAVALVDVDGNGRVDLVAVVQNGLGIWHDGDVSGSPVLLTAPSGTFRGVAAADLDGDGQVDLIGAHSEGIDVWPSALAASRVRIPVAGGVGAAVAFNVDGDAHFEVHHAAQGNTGVVVNDAADQFELAGGWTETPANGQVITVSGSSDNNGTYTVAAATGTVIQVTPGLVAEDPAGAAITIRWETVSSTGALDLVATTSLGVVQLRNRGEKRKLEFDAPVLVASVAATGLAANGDTLAVSDALGFLSWKGGAGPMVPGLRDDDGPAADGVAVGANGEIVLARSGAGHEVVDAGLFSYAKARAALSDLDRDGDLDFVTTASDGGNRVFWNVDGAFPGSDAVGHGFAEAGDVDGDGDLDLVTGTEDGRGVLVWRNDAGLFTPDAAALATGVVRGVRIAKLFGGGRPGILAITESGIVLFEDDGTGAFPGPGRHVAAVPGVLDLAVGDIDGDCLPDLVLGTARGVHRFVARPGGDFEAVPGASLAAAGDVRALLLVDIVVDGRLDLVTAGRGNATWLWSDVGGGNPLAAPLDPGPLWTEALAATDVDGDGKHDLLRGIFGAANRLHLTRPGAVTPQEPGGRWTEAVAIGDLDRDGDGDLVIRSRDAVDPDVLANE